MKKLKSVNIKDENQQKLSENIIWLLMYVISIIHGLMCISQGILSSCVTEIKQEFELSDENYGLFGTINGFGSLIGSLIFTLVIEKINHKNLICFMLLINCICHFAFFHKLEYPFLLLSRFISGFASVFCFIYFPMWVDKFGMKKWVNFMQTTVQISNTFGHIFGYFIFLILGSKQWKYGFLTEIFTITCFVFIMLIIPDKYYDRNYLSKESDVVKISDPYEIEKETVLKDIICNIPYILITLYRGNRLFIFVALDFWFSDYLQSSLMERNPSVIFWSYTTTIVIASLIGNILGGIIINLIGGTKSKHSFLAMGFLQFLCVFFGLFSPFTNSVLIFTILMSLYMILNSASGIISISASFSVMPKNLTGTATGIYSIIVNLIAFLPAPYVYAFIKTIFKKGSYIIIILMIYGIIGCVELFAADIYMRIKKIKLYKEDFKYVNIK